MAFSSREIAADLPARVDLVSANAIATSASPPWSANHGPITPVWETYSATQRWLYFGILFAVTASNYCDYYIVAVLLEPIKQEFHVSDTALGVLSGVCFAVIYAIAAFPIAAWADRGNRRTVIGVALCGWSLMTAACGLATAFWQLALARLGVGITEPGAMPPSQSLIADYFPPDRRAIATSILCGGASSVGWLLGVGAGGLIATHFGWRAAFLFAGAPGLLLALLVRMVLPEPRVERTHHRMAAHTESAWQSICVLREKRSFVLSVVSISIYTTFAYGVTVFVPSFMERSFHATSAQVGMPLGCAVAVANVGGSIIGGWLVGKLGRQDLRWYAWLPALACLVALPLYWAALMGGSLAVAIGIEFVAELVLGVGIPVVFASILVVCGAGRRSLASATLYCAMVLIGGTIGPLLTGVLSDLFSEAKGVESLRYSLIVMCIFLLPAAAVFWASGRSITQDQEL